ncbi:MAG: FAD-dependent oxidoreductase [Saprospiraceae bacterium]|nr:FAD-dependent oxidoreductase [Saprospiraceae bacterium]
MTQIDYRLLPSEIHADSAHQAAIRDQLNLDHSTPVYYKIIRRNIDARSKCIYYVFRAVIYNDQTVDTAEVSIPFQNVADRPPVHIIGAGPCGYFAALQLLELGLKPIILERGKDVRSRRVDLREIQQFGNVNPDSNYCFGEGGAGTYSDGKLYTRSDKRGNIQKVLKLFISHGADPDIQIDVHPHIGSNKLPTIVQNIRKTIEHFGGEIHFNTRVEDFIFENNEIKFIETNQSTIAVEHVILATGHSARSIYECLYRKNVSIETKSFAIGVRIEHPQSIIDEIQYKQKNRDVNLPPASYSVACQIHDKGVFSFCMCPGGLIIPAATAPGEIVVNGMSLSRRDSPFANSGIVTSVEPLDFKQYEKFGPLQGMMFQREIEQRMFSLGNGSQQAPAQRLSDFLKSRASADLPETSYIPGIFPVDFNKHLHGTISKRIMEGLKHFCNRMPLYNHADAIIVATESRTSAPVKIPRDEITCMHPTIRGFFPAGEGAGYAGGILSAAMDGQRVAKAVYEFIGKKQKEV